MLLVVNAGSSSIRLAVFEGATLRARAHAEKIGAGGPSDHAAALDVGLAHLATQGVPLAALGAVAHRVVHGGPRLTRTCRITPAVQAELDACEGLAPLHNPPALASLRALQARLPDLAQYAAFDTAFHATNPAVSTTYALPLAERDRGLRRYGFHGLSYAAIVRKMQENGPETLPSRMLSYHLGNGASVCAILDGRSVASSMGYSPLDGLTMGTRPGTLDPGVVLDLARRHGVAGAEDILNRQAGLLGLGGASDMRALHAAGTPEAEFAIDHFCHWAARHGASVCVAMGGVDAITFTGGIGENDPVVRQRIVAALGFLGAAIDASANARNAPDLHAAGSALAIRIVPADEEHQIALEVQALYSAPDGAQLHEIGRLRD